VMPMKEAAKVGDLFTTVTGDISALQQLQAGRIL